ncbi:hypothetical protein TVAG_363700 [Trichomonas vaginalis G3]|uniref:Uncharacterized protein n=1 Tax=Trichomonas vaginalis (strain ATCC PRA-98 / G3) TaxID=412133 RepID=A2EDT9_TRIV3|nr:hypothetical protein TVAGG3_0948660 [Trichomonas vaginalis G3]EAY09155.1 hypothetical protein TVAG_363700 [Trichomonas vaginalis G3]KAI5487056.1 hypothetical protein TVAGG3_0948660 [Trichomonas vaginalis G3]|eukprot:XP_001321378.1 hypothetical protein [Trichomonas vaginalis G3]
MGFIWFFKIQPHERRPNRYLVKFSLVILCFVVYFFNSDLQQKGSIQRIGKIFFGVITVPNSNRRDVPWKYWLRNLLDEGYHGAKFISPPQSDYPDHYYEPDPMFSRFLYGKVNFKSDRDRAIKRVAGAMYLSQNPQYDWYWSLTDDVYLDFEQVTNYIQELERTYEPRTQPVLKGQCLCAHNSRYLQGGAGYIFSKYAAKVFDNFSFNWIGSMRQYDDAHLIEVIKLYNFTFDDIRAYNIYGYEARKLDSYPKLPICPAKVSKTCCGYDRLNPMTDLMALHENSKARLIKVINLIQEIKRTNESIYYYYKDPWWIEPCRLNTTSLNSTTTTTK